MEVNPRRSRRIPVFVQVLVAVLSGAAAMYAVEHYKAPSWLPQPEFRPPPSKPAKPLKSSSREGSKLGRPKSKVGAPAPAASAMLVELEPDGAPKGMLRASGDDPARSPYPRSLSPFASQPGMVLHRARLIPRDPGVGDVKTTPRLLKAKGLAPEDEYAPPLTRPQDWEPKGMTDGEKLRVAGAIAIAVVGALFLLFGTTIIEAVGKRPPERP